MFFVPRRVLVAPFIDAPTTNMFVFERLQNLRDNFPHLRERNFKSEVVMLDRLAAEGLHKRSERTRVVGQ
jgi:hypothetical protein